MNRRLTILTVAVILALSLPAALLGPDPAAARTRHVTKSYDVSVACTEKDGLHSVGDGHDELWIG